MTKSWRYDGPSAVQREMMDEAFSSPEHFSQRSITASKELLCEVCFQPIPAWSTYHYTCFIEDGEPQFIRQHIFCPREYLL
jgi:hypothetical protein